MKTKICKCKQCRAARGKAGSKAKVKAAKGSARRHNKVAIKKGKYEALKDFFTPDYFA